MLPKEARGTSPLSTRGWRILQLIHEMQNRGNASQTWLEPEGAWWGKGPEMKGLIVVCGFPQTLRPLVGGIGKEVQVLLYLIGDSKGEGIKHWDSPTPNTSCLSSISKAWGCRVNYESKLSPASGAVTCECWVQLPWLQFFSQKELWLVMNALFTRHLHWPIPVGACNKKMLIAFEEFLCLVYGGVTRDEVLTFQSKAVLLNFVERSWWSSFFQRSWTWDLTLRNWNCAFIWETPSIQYNNHICFTFLGLKWILNVYILCWSIFLEILAMREGGVRFLETFNFCSLNFPNFWPLCDCTKKSDTHALVLVYF